MKTTLILNIEIDLPEDISREDIKTSMDEVSSIWLQKIDKTVPATVKAVDFKETHE
jgi:hypothetical protein